MVRSVNLIISLAVSLLWILGPRLAFPKFLIIIITVLSNIIIKIKT